METLLLLAPIFDLGIISHARPSRRTVELEKLGLKKFFPNDLIFISTELGMWKTDKAIFEYAIGHSGHAPELILYSDDQAKYLPQAKEAGIEKLILFSEQKNPKYFTVKEFPEVLEYEWISELL